MMLVAGACGGGQTVAPRPGFEVSDTVPLGELPEQLSDRSSIPAPPTTPPESAATTTEPLRDVGDGPIADAVVGYRVLLIGDTVLASTAPRNDGVMCDVLVDFGWTVEIAAEPGRFIEFGEQVLDERLQPVGDEQWDAVAVMLGNHFDGDLDGYTRRLEALLERLSPRPTIVYTLSEVSDDAVAINAVVRDLPRSHPNVVVVDWAEVTVVDPGRIFEDDGPELSRNGAEVFVLHTAAALGKTPRVESGGIGECLPSVFTDDTAIVL
jgi:hypothetical protein